MAQQRQLAHPPLREALIDIRIAEELPQSFIDGIAGQGLPGYATVTKMWRGRVTFALTVLPSMAPPPSSGGSEQFGWRYDSNDGARVAQFRRDGLTFSVLKGYTTWADAKSSAQELWGLYCRWGSPRLVKRLAVRYINVLNLPKGEDSDNYLTAGPRIPSELPQLWSGFLYRVVIPFTADEASAIVTQAMEPPLESSVPIVLDIDVFLERVLAPDSTEIWAKLDKLRDIKNRIFFASVTEKALEPHR